MRNFVASLCLVLISATAAFGAAGEVGDACNADGTCTGGTLVCENSLCKIKSGQDCSSNTAECVMHATCSSTCGCGSAYTASTTGTCVGNVALGNACTADSECAAAQSTCTDSKCACATGYKKDSAGTGCESDSGAGVTTLSIVLLLASFVTSRFL